MYRRVNSGRFIVATTAGIVIIMAIFTWVMYGMAQQVNTMTDVMVTLGKDFSHMVVLQEGMASDIHNMSGNIDTMSQNIILMNQNITGMGEDVAVLSGSIKSMNANMSRMTYDISKATYAFSQPMSYMFNTPFGF